MHERFSAAKLALSQKEAEAKGVQLLSAEALSELESAQTDVDASLKSKREKQAELAAHLAWWKEHQKSHQEKTQAEAQQSDAETKWKDANPRLDKLEQSEPAEKLRMPYERWQTAMNSAESASVALSAKQNVLQSTTEKSAQADQALLKASDTLTLVKAQQRELETLVSEHVLPLDTDIKHQSQRHQELSLQNSGLTNKQGELTVSQSKIAEQLDAKNGELETVTTYLSKHQSAGQLKQYLGQWAQMGQQLSQEQNAIAGMQKQEGELTASLHADSERAVSADKEKQAAYTQSENAKQAWEVQQQAFSKATENGDVETLDKQRELLNTQLSVHMQLSQWLQQWLEIDKDCAEKRHVLAEQTLLSKAFEQDVTALRQQYKDKKQLIDALSKLVCQEEHLAQYRAALQPHEACPLCGATEHPALLGAVLDVSDTLQQKAAAEMELKELENIGKETGMKLEVCKRYINELEKHLARNQQQQVALRDNWVNTASSINLSVTIDQQDAFAAFNDEQLRARDALTQTLASLKTQEKTLQQTKQQWDDAARLLASTDQALSLLSLSVENKQREVQKLTADKGKKQDYLETLQSVLSQQILESGYTPPEDSALTAWLEARSQDAEAWDQNNRRKDILAKEVALLEVELANCVKDLNALAEQQHALQSDINALLSTLESAKAKRAEIFGNKLIDEEKRRFTEQTEQTENAYKAAQSQAQQCQGDLRAIQAEVTSQTQTLENLTAEFNTKSVQWEESLSASPFDALEAFQSALLPEDEKQQMLAEKRGLENALEGAKVLLLKAMQHVQDVLAHEHATEWQTVAMETVESDAEVHSEQLHQLVKRSGEISNELASDKQRRENQQALFAEIERLRTAYDDIHYLHSLIGSQKGDKFRKFAQGLTLDNLVYLANKQLDRIHGRYQLNRKQGEGLELSVLDTWQGDIERDTKTLSGGESFLVSLALALALSDLVSHKTSIDSLFLDEGFGTLDSETLDVALDALDNLNASGKMIGVISHIEAMKERIPTQLKVSKKTGLGISELERVYRVDQA
nr:SbcC/MukB-like Walker B domain-containing protein [Enterovibrio nigricans]